MPLYLACYDLPLAPDGAHQAMRDRASAHGWNTQMIAADGDLADLPNTTLVGNFETMQAASEALARLRDSAGGFARAPVAMTPYVIVPAEPYLFLANRPPEQRRYGGLGSLGGIKIP